MSELAALLDASLAESTLRFVTPILLAALGGLLCERAGVFNIALEGLMLSGAFAAVAGSYWAASSGVGVLAAVAAGVVMASLLAAGAVTLRGNDVVLGIALNLLASGLTVFLLRSLFGVKGAFQHPRVIGLARLSPPGEPLVLSGHTWITWASWLLAAAVWVLLFRHRWGLRLRGVGEHPQAAATLGVRVAGVRWAAVLASGALCGLAGAQLALGNVTLFVENMSAGRGWIAVVAVMLGRAHPGGVLAASLLFGFTDSLGFRLQGLDFPSQLTEALPYLVTLASLFLFARRGR